LQVGSLTDDRRTHCYSIHLTTFAGSFVALPAPVNWDYVFANADFMRNKTIYLTVIGVGVLYLLLLILARFRDKNDRDKVRHTQCSLPSLG
jgi:heme/copper-type cytochrome/quinol oxidase subunit 2